jgi:UDP-3-O-[3-hydroxymyristoyl] glucosamine N-acyltransferase LpxD
VQIEATGPIDSNRAGTLAFLKESRFEEYRNAHSNPNLKVIITSRALGSKIQNLAVDLVFTAGDTETENLFYSIHNKMGEYIDELEQPPRVSKSARIATGVVIPDGVVIHDGATLESGVVISPGVVVGENSFIGANTVIARNVEIGSETIIGAGNVIGGIGFRFTDIGTINTRVNHYGNVRIGNNVDIGSNCSIDRATFEADSTSIADNVKINNLVHIAHNVSIGESSVICAHVTISGSVEINERCYVAPKAAIRNHATLGADSTVYMGAIVTRDVAPGSKVSGNFARPHEQSIRANKFLETIGTEDAG